MAIAYLANSFPETLESYVWEEICELRTKRVRVLPCSIKRPHHSSNADASLQTLYEFPLRLRRILQATWACARQFSRIKDFFGRAISGPETLTRHVRTLVHTWIGVYLAIMLRNERIRHIHVHHGYFASWAGMVAARILGASFSMTLHGSDLLVRADYLDIKLKNCRFCVTISDFNRQHILRNYPEVDSRKIVVQRVGIDTKEWRNQGQAPSTESKTILSVGRLHTVKNHAFLVLACRALKSGGAQFRCSIAGDGEERLRLKQLINALGLEQEVKLLGHVPREHLADLYDQADLVVLTSRSEGIPVTLMEAMSMEKLVLAPEITGIPELVKDGKTGFLYQPNSMEHFLHKLQFILHVGSSLDGIRQAARRHVERDFNRSLNLEKFAHNFLERLGAIQKPALIPAGRGVDEDPVLQQVQLSV
jgi:colanic acid/amylovoran biosynthesis glycosyltransferase